MGKLAKYAEVKDKMDKDIADEARRLYLEGMDYQAALGQAKEMFLNKEATKCSAKQSW